MMQRVNRTLNVKAFKGTFLNSMSQRAIVCLILLP